MGFRRCLRPSAKALVLAFVCVAAPVFARGSELSETEVASLYAGHAVVREETTQREGHRYVGGVSYILIDSPPERVMGVLDDVATYRNILPKTRSVRWIGLTRHEGDSLVELEQGNSFAHGRYTVRLHREPSRQGSSSGTVQFRLDDRFPHDIEDASGYFRVEPLGDRTLLTYLVTVDVGSGLFARMFENRVRKVALSTPEFVKHFVESPAAQRYPAL